MQNQKEHSPLELYQKLIYIYEDMLSIENRLPWQLRLAHFRLQLILCGRVHKLRKAMQNYRMSELSRDDKKKLIELFKEFENDQKPEIFEWTVDRKFHWYFSGLVAVVIALILFPESTLSKIGMLLDLPKGISTFALGDIFKLLSSFPMQFDTIFVFLLVISATGMACNLIFYGTDQFLILYMRSYYKFPGLEIFYDAIKKYEDLKSIQSGLLESLPSYPERLEFDALENLPTSPPSVSFQSDMWSFLFLSIFSFAVSIPFMLLALEALLSGKLDERSTTGLVVVLLVYAIASGYVGVFSVLQVIKRREFTKALIVSASNGIYSRKFSLTKNP